MQGGGFGKYKLAESIWSLLVYSFGGLGGGYRIGSVGGYFFGMISDKPVNVN